MKKLIAGLDADTIAFTILTSGEAMHSYSSFLPSFFTIRNWVLCAENGNEISENISNLRSGYKPAFLLSTGLAAFISVIAKSPLPILAAIGTNYAMIRLYESALPKEKRRDPLGLLLGNFSLDAPSAQAGIEVVGQASMLSDIVTLGLTGL